MVEKVIMVEKRDGSSEPYSQEKMLNLLKKVSEGYPQDNLQAPLNIARLVVSDGIKTSTLVHTLKMACVDNVSIQEPYWQNIAGRLTMTELYNEAKSNMNCSISELYSPIIVNQHISDYVKKGLYFDVYNSYSHHEIQQAISFIDKGRDDTYGHSTATAFAGRYLLNPNKYISELPQVMYLMIALHLGSPESKETRMEFVKDLYEVTSLQQLSLPTPTLLNARTKNNQLASCFVLNMGDDLDSIYHEIGNSARISKMGGGIGMYLGNIRAKGSSIQGIENVGGGVVPFAKVLNDTGVAVNQMGKRNGAISVTLDIWHLDIEDFLNMQTETGDARSKCFDLFPAVSIPDLFMERVREDGEWTMFDPKEIKDVFGMKLQDFYGDEFKAIYERLENDSRLKVKNKIKAKDLFKEVLQVVVETGMPYVYFRDTGNRLNPNKHAGMIYASNLCTEMQQNTSPSKLDYNIPLVEYDEEDVSVELGTNTVCTLASINLGKVNERELIDKVARVCTRALDNVLDLNLYPTQESKKSAMQYRSIGIGLMGLAEFLAKNGLDYEREEAREVTDKLLEVVSYSVLKYSNKLSQERGAYPLFKGSDWEKGIVFGRDIEHYKYESPMGEEWEELIENIQDSGVRFSYHLSPAPNTSTAKVTGTTAGLLPIYKKLFIETDAIAPIVMIAPDLSPENMWYYKEYSHCNMENVIDMFSVIYKWIDQAASFEWQIDPAKTSPKDLYGFYFRAWEKGLKTVYYVRSMSASMDAEVCESCVG